MVRDFDNHVPPDDSIQGFIDRARTQTEQTRAALDRKERLPPPDSFPGYTLLREVHRGGQGVVYEATQDKTRRRVAIKVVRDGAFAIRVEHARFEREIMVLAQFQHPNIVRLYDGGAANGRLYYAMDFVEGMPFDAYVRNAGCTVQETLRLFVKIAGAVHAAHLKGIVHRDLKPSNIRVDGAGEPHLLDFGLAKLMHDEHAMPHAESITATGQFTGSLPWAAPEQVDGSPDGVDIRTDVYALGVLLFHALTDRFPYEIVASMRRVMENILQAEAPRPSELRAGIDDDVDTIVLKCLSKNRDRRYQSAGALVQDIEHYLAGEPIEAKRDSHWYVLKTVLRRHKRLTILSATYVIVITAFAVAMSLLAGRIRDERDASRQLNRKLTIETARSEMLFGDAVRAADLLWRARLNSSSVPGVNPSAESLDSYWAMWDLYNRQPCLATWQAHTGSVAGLFLGPGGDLLASLGRSDGTVKFWDPKHARLDLALDVRGPAGDSFGGISPDGARLALGHDDGTLRLWNIKNHVEEARLEGHTGRVGAAVFTPDGNLLVSGGDDGSIRLWNPITHESVSAVFRHQVPIIGLAVSRNGSLLVSCDRSGLINLWDLPQAGLRSTLEPPRPTIDPITAYSVDFAPDGSTVAFARDHSVFTWDTSTGSKRELYQHSDAAIAVRFSPCGKWLASSGRERLIVLWSLEQDRISQTFAGNHAMARCLEFIPNEGAIASALDDGAIKLWQLQPHPAFQRLNGHQGTVHSVQYTPDGRFLVSSGYEEQPRIRVWDAASRQLLYELAGHSSVIAAVAVHPDGRRVASAGYDGSLRVWDLKKGVCLQSSDRAHPSRINTVAYSPDGLLLATGGDDSAVRLWDASSLTVVQTFQESSGRIPQVCFSPDGKWLASCNWSEGLRVRDLKSFETQTLSSSRGARALCFSPDGRRLASGGDDRTITIWNVANGSMLESWEAHTYDIFSLAFHPNGRILASAGRGRDVRLWDTVSPSELLATLQSHDDMVLSLSFHPDGGRLASGSRDTSIGLWDLDYYDRHVAGNLEFQRDRVGRQDAHPATHARKPGAVP